MAILEALKHFANTLCDPRIFFGLSIVLLFAIMAVVLIVRPWGLLGRPEA